MKYLILWGLISIIGCATTPPGLLDRCAIKCELADETFVDVLFRCYGTQHDMMECKPKCICSKTEFWIQ